MYLKGAIGPLALEKSNEKELVRALAVAGIVGNLVKTNASISGAEGENCAYVHGLWVSASDGEMSSGLPGRSGDRMCNGLCRSSLLVGGNHTADRVRR